MALIKRGEWLLNYYVFKSFCGLLIFFFFWFTDFQKGNIPMLSNSIIKLFAK